MTTPKKWVRCFDCFRYRSGMKFCRAGEKFVGFTSDRYVRARRVCGAYMPECTYVEGGNVARPGVLRLFDGKQWHAVPRRVPVAPRLH